jgi:hypothetical protein
MHLSMTMRLPILPLCAVMLSLPANAACQELGFINALFSKVHSITIYGEGVELPADATVQGRSKCAGMDICGAGTEVLIDLASAPVGTHFELGLGASYLRGLTSNAPDLDLRGAVRSFPTFAAYVTGINTPLSQYVEPYVGASFGISDLWNARAYDSTNTATPAKAQTFEFGGTVGGYVNYGLLDGLFVELSYRYRRFDGIDWGRTAVPVDWPRQIDLSGWSVQIGWQFDMKDRPHHAPDLDGMWELSRVNGQPLPFTVQAKLDASQITKTEILHSLASFSDGQFRLALTRRNSRLDATGKLLTTEVPTDTAYTGRYETQDGEPRILLTGSRIRIPVRRVGDEIALSLPDPGNGVVLYFKKLQ